MGFYRKRPVVIEAIQLRDDTADEILDRFVPNEQTPLLLFRQFPEMKVLGAEIQTLEGNHRAEPGDYIIKGIQGELYPCKPDIFRATYEEADS